MSLKQSDLLAPNYIFLETERDGRGDQLVHGIVFKLTQNSLPTLLSIKTQGLRLKFSRPFVLSWQHYALFHDGTDDLRRTWSFTLNYETQGIFQTLITRDGEIVNQVCADILSHSVLQQQLQEVHFWLMEQLLQKLGLRPPQGRWIHNVAWLGAIAITLGFTFLFLGTVINNPLLILPIILAIGGLKWLLNWLLNRYILMIRGFVVRQLLWGKFSGDRHQQLKGLQYLRRLWSLARHNSPFYKKN